MKKNLTIALGVVAGGCFGTAALADYPERPVNMVIPYGPGGATDISARALSAPLGEIVGEPLIMVNRAGAGGTTGSVSVQNADPDGYTLLFARVGTHTVNPAMKETLPYTLDDFEYIGVYEINPVACAVAAGSDIDSMETLAQRVRDNPGTIAYSSSGVGSLLHLAGAMALKEFGVENPVEEAIHIPLGGGGEAATAVLTGTAAFVCTNTSALANFVANGQLRPLMVTTPEPVEGFDAPTAAELGKPALEQLVGWTGLAGPAGLDPEIVAQWGDWLGQAVQDPAFAEQMESLGSVIDLMDPQESEAFIRGQYEVFDALVDELGMQVEG